MQPTDYEESQLEVKLLCKTVERLLDLSTNGARLMPLAFGY